MENWQIQKAKNHFSDLIRKAQEKGRVKEFYPEPVNVKIHR